MAERGLTVGRVLILVMALGGVFAVGVLVGWGVRGEPEHTATETLQASQIGNTVEGRRIYSAYSCSACHAYRGVGGTDGPALDFMRGKLTAQEIANMSGRIWNHVPDMVTFFKEEGLEVPQFSGNEMADLVAYLHGGGAAPEPPKQEHMDEGEEGGHADEEKGGHADEEKGGKGDEESGRADEHMEGEDKGMAGDGK